MVLWLVKRFVLIQDIFFLGPALMAGGISECLTSNLEGLDTHLVYKGMCDQPFV